MDQQAEKIYETLTKQAFCDWYTDNGRFERHLQGGDRTLPSDSEDYVPTKEEILADIVKMFNLRQ